MASTSGVAQSPSSDNEPGERPVRKQLKETSIDAATTSSDSRRKRSLDEARDATDADADSESRRKRSRDCTPQSEHVGTQTVSSPPSDPAPVTPAAHSDLAQGVALAPVDFPDFDWIAQLDARDEALEKRERLLQEREASLKQREK